MESTSRSLAFLSRTDKCPQYSQGSLKPRSALLLSGMFLVGKGSTKLIPCLSRRHPVNTNRRCWRQHPTDKSQLSIMYNSMQTKLQILYGIFQNRKKYNYH